MSGYKAIQMEAPAGSEIMGVAVADWTENLASEITTPILAKYGLHADDIEPDGWYDMNIVADFYREVLESQGGSSALVAMGKSSVPRIIESFGLKTFEDFLERIDEPFSSAIRNIPDEYGLLVKDREDGKCKIVNNSIVPNDMIYGYIWEMLARLNKPGGHMLLVPLTDYTPESKEGALYEVEWDVSDE